MGSSKVPLLEKASEDTGQYQQWWESVTVLERLLCEEEALVTFTSSEIMSRVLSILRVPLRTHQEDDCQCVDCIIVAVTNSHTMTIDDSSPGPILDHCAALESVPSRAEHYHHVTSD
ncbi:hypothetical protein F2P81_005716 [Scophthalmus maximus]|uniref:Uncharacterized protein n=1 Tax=Scophthalmus maximus TaxID=52904 RepID=A0A6A4TG31_SCOMX|nr:hypothetical protein F2P81_005716 [Scophthalmus maximus]